MAKRSVGRPPKYTKSMPDKLVSYFAENSKMEIVDGKWQAPIFPTLARFAIREGITRETLHDWATKRDDEGELVYPEFSYAYGLAKAHQEAVLVEGGMQGCYSGAFLSLAAKNLISWRDARDVNVGGQEGGAPIKFEVVGVKPGAPTG